MGVDFYACANCETTFPDCGDYVSCEQCYRHYCCGECADLTPIIFKRINFCGDFALKRLQIIY
jgi:hypothetical protein